MSIFRAPKIPKPPAVPTRDTAREEQSVRDALSKRRGAAASILTGAQGDTTPIQTAAKKLLGE